MSRAGRSIFFLFLLLSLSGSSSQALDINGLWALVASYEYVGIGESDLATFLISHGYDARPNQSWVEVGLPDRTVYLTPNGGAKGLADMWMHPPEENRTPLRVVAPDAIRKDVVLQESHDSGLYGDLSRVAVFPVKPLGMCFEGAEQLFKLYNQSGYHPVYLYDTQDEDSQGHIWVAIKDEKQNDSWKAVDSYFGVMSGDEYYYRADYSFPDFKYLDMVTPKWRVG